MVMTAVYKALAFSATVICYLFKEGLERNNEMQLEFCVEVFLVEGNGEASIWGTEGASQE